MTPKLQDRGVQCMLVGYALDHYGDCYRMWDPVTGGIHVTRYIIWLKRMFYEKGANADGDEIIPMVEKVDGGRTGHGNY
jgi:hypothetical protein